MGKQGNVSAQDVVAAENDRVRTKLDAEIEAVQVQLAEATATLAALDKEYDEAVRAERKAWGNPAKEPTGKKLYEWLAVNKALERVVGRRFGAFDVVQLATQRLRKLQDPATYDERKVATQVNQERFAELRERVGPRARTPRQPKLNPPGSDALVAAMEAAKPGYQAYVAAQETLKEHKKAGTTASAPAVAAEGAMAKLRPEYQAYRKAYNGLLALRKEHREAVEAMANGGQ